MARSVRTYGFLAVQAILYIIFMYNDIAGRNAGFSNYVKFFSVVLCLLYVLLHGKSICSGDRPFLLGALFFTVISDYIILFKESGYYLYGMITFLTAQQLHGIRLTVLRNSYKQLGKKKILPSFFLRALLLTAITAAICFTLSLAGMKMNGLLIVVILYFTSLMINVLRCAKLAVQFPKDRRIVLYAFGLFLFLLCDINVGIFNLPDFIPLSGSLSILYSLSTVLMWAFYLPSQVMIALSFDMIQQ